MYVQAAAMSTLGPNAAAYPPLQLTGWFASVQVEVHMSLYAPDGDMFIGVKLLASLADGGAAPGSVSASTEVNSVRLFHWRFPPSEAFEVVVGTIIASQIVMTLWRMATSPFGMVEFLRRERSLYDVTLLALFVWLLVKVRGICVRAKLPPQPQISNPLRYRCHVRISCCGSKLTARRRPFRLWLPHLSLASPSPTVGRQWARRQTSWTSTT